jgi:hypothetical protein
MTSRPCRGTRRLTGIALWRPEDALALGGMGPAFDAPMNHRQIAVALGCGLAATAFGCNGSTNAAADGSSSAPSVSQLPGNGSTAGGDASQSLLGSGGCSQGTPQTVGPNDMTPLGMSATLLAAVAGTHVASLTWGTPTAQPDFVVHPTGTTRLTIDVSPMDGGVQFLPEVMTDGGSGGLALCGPGSFTIAATVHLVTDDLGFNETWQESLVSEDGQSASFTRDLQQDPPAGSFSVTYTGTQTWNSTSLPLAATFSASGTRGDVYYDGQFMSFTGPNSGGGGGVHMQVAAWVPESTDGGLDAAEAGDAQGSADGAAE